MELVGRLYDSRTLVDTQVIFQQLANIGIYQWLTIDKIFIVICYIFIVMESFIDKRTSNTKLYKDFFSQFT
jgi:uncharacterized membrane protein SirB2